MAEKGQSMTIEELEQITYLRNSLKDLDQRISASYDTVKSPSFTAFGGSKYNYSDPTAKSFENREKMINNYNSILIKYLGLIEKTEDFFDTIESHDVIAIMRYHYEIGLTWSETSKKMNPNVYSDSRASKAKLDRYIESHKKQFES